MKGTIFVVFAVVTACSALKPSCTEDELNKLWPDYFESTAFYKCEGFREPVHEKCEDDLWFSFKHQACVNPSDWEEPPLPVPRTPVQILPLSVPKESLERFARFLFTNRRDVPSEPSYPPTTSGYPTPPTPVPSHPPTPPPTVPPTASPTYPPKPPTNAPSKF